MNIPIVLNKEHGPEGSSELYWKGQASYINNELKLQKGTKVDFSTYFNLLPIGSFQEYIDTKSWSLVLDVVGDAEISVTAYSKNKQEILFSGNSSSIEAFTVSKKHIFIGFSINAVSDCKIKSASWKINTRVVEKTVKPVIVICTFNRHDFIHNTIQKLANNLPENWGVVVVDNGSEPAIESEYKQDSRFSFFRNPNTGGAGGFTRGIIEALKADTDWTHVLLMDDDIVIEPAALYKTHLLLKNLKPELADHFIGGAMLRLDTPVVQHESGAHWNGWRVIHYGHNVKINRIDSLIKAHNESKKYNSYAAWWYCVIPLCDEMKDDLPKPFFVNGDDIEYSMRRAKGIVHLNGIAVWHEPFHLKYNPIKQHYLTTRNGLAINIRHGFTRLHNVFMSGVRYFLQRIKGNKNEANLVCLGIRDFLKGPGYLMHAGNPFKIKNIPHCSYWGLIKLLFKLLTKHRRLRKSYKQFRINGDFWDSIYKIAEESK